MLVVRLKDVLLVITRDSLAFIRYTHFYSADIGRDVHFNVTRYGNQGLAAGELNSVRYQVGQNLLESLGVKLEFYFTQLCRSHLNSDVLALSLHAIHLDDIFDGLLDIGLMRERLLDRGTFAQ